MSITLDFFYSLNSLSNLSAIILAIANELVAPGLGAFLQCNTRLPIASFPLPLYMSKTKSSIKFPKKTLIADYKHY